MPPEKGEMRRGGGAYGMNKKRFFPIGKLPLIRPSLKAFAFGLVFSGKQRPCIVSLRAFEDTGNFILNVLLKLPFP
jgi:hypothetical protein